MQTGWKVGFVTRHGINSSTVFSLLLLVFMEYLTFLSFYSENRNISGFGFEKLVFDISSVEKMFLFL